MAAAAVAGERRRRMERRRVFEGFGEAAAGEARREERRNREHTINRLNKACRPACPPGFCSVVSRMKASSSSFDVASLDRSGPRLSQRLKPKLQHGRSTGRERQNKLPGEICHAQNHPEAPPNTHVDPTATQRGHANEQMETTLRRPERGATDWRRACGRCQAPMHDHLAALFRGVGGRHPRAIHGAAIKLGCLASTYLCNNLLPSYHGRVLLADARSLFDEMPRRNLVSWSVLISGASRLGALGEAFLLFSDMLRSVGRESCDRPNSFALGPLVAGCARTKDVVAGSQVHPSTVKFGVDEDKSVAGALVDMYA